MAFLSSRIEESESKLLSAAGARVEFGGLMDVETMGVLGSEDELVCSFKLVCMYIYGFRAHQHLRSLAPVLNDE